MAGDSLLWEFFPFSYCPGKKRKSKNIFMSFWYNKLWVLFKTVKQKFAMQPSGGFLLKACKFFSYFLKKKYLLVGPSGMSWTGQWMSECQWVSEWVRNVCISHQSDWIFYKQPIKFLVLLQIHVTRYFYLLVSNGNLTLLFLTVRINWQTRSQSSGMSRKMFGPSFLNVFRGF